MKFSKSIGLIVVFALLANSLSAQFRIDRKIIIENGQFYFFTINEETQLATMYTGSVNEKLNKAKKYPMPIGRELNDQFNPLSFDINNGVFIGINWILNSMNSRYESIKKINLKDWKKPHSEWTNEDWAQVSFDLPIAAPNEPWDKMLEANNVLNNTFFDLIQTDGKLIMALCNQDELRISEYYGEKWHHAPPIPVKFTHQFWTLQNAANQIGILDSDGNLYRYNKMKWILAEQTQMKQIGDILVVDKDHNKTYTLSTQSIEANPFNNLNAIIKDSATEIIF